MQHQTIRSALLDLISTGDLAVVDGRLHFMGEPLEDMDAGEYRGDGWSHETSFGCRRHRAIDEFVERLARGDEHERRVANEADLWFCFHPRECVHLAADDETEAKQAAAAYSNSMIMARWLGLGVKRDHGMDFRISSDKWGIEGETYWHMPQAHKVVYGMRPEAEAPDRWPQQYINDLRERVEYYREGRGDDEDHWWRDD